MTRLVKHIDQGPSIVKSENSIFICRCGLTKNTQGLCDQSHKRTLSEQKDKVYCYDESGKRMEILDCCDNKEKCCNCC